MATTGFDKPISTITFLDEYNSESSYLADRDNSFPEDFIVGDRVWLNGIYPARIQYIGETHLGPGDDWAGLVLDEPIGKHDGQVNGRRYYYCENKKGIFARLSKLTRIPLRAQESPDSGTLSPSADYRHRPLTSPTSILKKSERNSFSSRLASRPDSSLDNSYEYSYEYNSNRYRSTPIRSQSANRNISPRSASTGLFKDRTNLNQDTSSRSAYQTGYNSGFKNGYNAGTTSLPKITAPIIDTKEFDRSRSYERRQERLQSPDVLRSLSRSGSRAESPSRSPFNLSSRSSSLGRTRVHPIRLEWEDVDRSWDKVNVGRDGLVQTSMDRLDRRLQQRADSGLGSASIEQESPLPSSDDVIRREISFEKNCTCLGPKDRAKGERVRPGDLMERSELYEKYERKEVGDQPLQTKTKDSEGGSANSGSTGTKVRWASDESDSAIESNKKTQVKTTNRITNEVHNPLLGKIRFVEIKPILIISKQEPNKVQIEEVISDEESKSKIALKNKTDSTDDEKKELKTEEKLVIKKDKEKLKDEAKKMKKEQKDIEKKLKHQDKELKEKQQTKEQQSFTEDSGNLITKSSFHNEPRLDPNKLSKNLNQSVKVKNVDTSAEAKPNFSSSLKSVEKIIPIQREDKLIKISPVTSKSNQRMIPIQRWEQPRTSTALDNRSTLVKTSDSMDTTKTSSTSPVISSEAEQDREQSYAEEDSSKWRLVEPKESTSTPSKAYVFRFEKSNREIEQLDEDEREFQKDLQRRFELERGRPILRVGDRVFVDSSKGFISGRLRYLGPTKFKAGHWAGIQLDVPRGKNDGKVEGIRYFTARPNYGLFAPCYKVHKVDERRSSLFHRMARFAKDALKTNGKNRSS